MTLREYLKTLLPDTFVYLSAGEGFFYIGAEPLKDLPKCDTAYYEKIKRAVKRNESELRYAKNRVEKYGVMITKQNYGNATKSSLEYAYKSAQADLKRLPRTIKKHKQTLKSRVDFLDRNVVDVLKREWVEPLGLIIKVEGGEHGYYWTYNEWLKSPYKVERQKEKDDFDGM